MKTSFTTEEHYPSEQQRATTRNNKQDKYVNKDMRVLSYLFHKSVSRRVIQTYHTKQKAKCRSQSSMLKRPHSQNQNKDKSQRIVIPVWQHIHGRHIKMRGQTNQMSTVNRSVVSCELCVQTAMQGTGAYDRDAEGRAYQEVSSSRIIVKKAYDHKLRLDQETVVNEASVC